MDTLNKTFNTSLLTFIFGCGSKSVGTKTLGRRVMIKIVWSPKKNVFGLENGRAFFQDDPAPSYKGTPRAH